MVDRRGARNWGARLLAPVVFFAAITLLVLIVQSSLDDDGSSSPPPAVTTTTGGAAGTETASADTSAAESGPAATEPSGPKKTYRVKSGDTLESIAARFDTTVADLLELNPDIDPLALRPNQKIRIR